MILYATPLSSFCCKVRLALALKGVTVEERMPPGGYRSQQYRAIVPTGRVPGLVDGEFVLGESDAIIEYVDETQPGPDLLPPEPRARARCRFISRFNDFYLDPPLRALFPELDPRLRSIERVVQRCTELTDRLAELDELVSAEPYLVDRAPTLADCAVAPSLLLAEIILPRLDQTFEIGPKLRAWWPRLQEHAVLQRVLNPYRAVSNAWAASKLAAP